MNKLGRNFAPFQHFHLCIYRTSVKATMIHLRVQASLFFFFYSTTGLFDTNNAAQRAKCVSCHTFTGSRHLE